MNRLVLIMGGIVLVVLLAGAAFVAARLLNSPEETRTGQSEIAMISNSGGGQVAFSLDIKPAPELPATPPEVNGLYVRHEDNSIFVGTGEIQFSMTIDKTTGQRQSSADHSGPVLEVVVTRETTLYRDETPFPEPSSAGGGKQTIQQVVLPIESLDDLGQPGQNAEVQVWGTRSGDRVTAQVFVYRPMDGG